MVRQARRRSAGAPRPKVAGSRVKYDGLNPGQHTWIEIDRDHPAGHGITRTAASKAAMEKMGFTKQQEEKHSILRVNPGDVVTTGDLEDGSDRSRIINGHLERGVCRFVE